MNIIRIAAQDFSVNIQAFLMALSFRETENDSFNYRELCGGTFFQSFDDFPQWEGYGNPVSHAAGRYQFEPATWRDRKERLALPDFSPRSQDLAAWSLASEVYQRKTHGRVLLDDLNSNYLDLIVSALHSTWPSLNNLFSTLYNTALAQLQSQPAPVSSDTSVPPSRVATAGQGAMLGGISVAMITPIVQWLLSWPISRPSDAVCAGIAGLILAGAGFVGHLNGRNA